MLKILVNENKNKKNDSTLVNQIDHFADVVFKKVRPKVNGNDGLISLKIFAAITKSAAGAQNELTEPIVEINPAPIAGPNIHEAPIIPSWIPLR